MYTTIISAEKLKKIINEKNLIIFDCRFDLMNKDKGYSEYLESHIRGAHYINLESDLSSPADPPKPILALPTRLAIMSQIPSKEPPQMNKMFEVSI